MTAFFTQFGGYAGVAASIVTVVFVLIGYSHKESRALKKEEADTAKNVIDLLTNKVTVLEDKVNEMEIKIDELTAENRTLRDVLQGRDVETKQYYKDAYAMMEVIKHNDKISEENSKILARLSSLLEIYVNK